MARIALIVLALTASAAYAAEALVPDSTLIGSIAGLPLPAALVVAAWLLGKWRPRITLQVELSERGQEQARKLKE